MRFFKRDDETYIVVEATEEELAVLRAIVKASFDLANPVGLSVLNYHPEYSLSDAEADQWIKSITGFQDYRVVDMNFVQGRECKTILSKDAPGQFRLNTKYFERYRGSCMPMLERARELVSRNGAIRSDDRMDVCAAMALAAGK
jgi:hypothetical protein